MINVILLLYIDIIKFYIKFWDKYLTLLLSLIASELTNIYYIFIDGAIKVTQDDHG